MSLGWGVGMLTFMLTCVTCTSDVTSLGWGGGDVNVHVSLRHMQVWRYVTGLGGIVLCKETTQKENNKKPILIHTGGVDAMSLDQLQRPC